MEQTNVAFDPTQAVAPVVTVQPQLSMAELLEEAAADMSNMWVEGDYTLRVVEFNWHYSDDDKALGLINSARGGCAKFTFLVTEGPGNTPGKKYTKYFHFKSGTSTGGYRWDDERDLMQWLIKHGINVETQVPAVEIDNVRMVKETYSNIGMYITAFGGDYTLRLTAHKTKEGEFNDNWKKCPILFDEHGNPMNKPMPTLTALAPAAIPAPVAVAQPVAPATPEPVAVVQPAIPTPVQPVAVAPAIPAPVAPAIPVPVAVVQPVAPVVPIPVAVAPQPVAPAPAQPVATGLPTGLPGLPVA